MAVITAAFVGIVEQLEHECEVISSMLKDVVAIEAATGASPEAKARHWTPALVSTGRLYAAGVCADKVEACRPGLLLVSS